jgi:hypothetical protein
VLFTSSAYCSNIGLTTASSEEIYSGETSSYATYVNHLAFGSSSCAIGNRCFPMALEYNHA